MDIIRLLPTGTHTGTHTGLKILMAMDDDSYSYLSLTKTYGLWYLQCDRIRVGYGTPTVWLWILTM